MSNLTPYPIINHLITLPVHKKKDKNAIGQIYQLVPNRYDNVWGKRGYKPYLSEHYYLNYYVYYFYPKPSSWFHTQYFYFPSYAWISFFGSWSTGKLAI